MKKHYWCFNEAAVRRSRSFVDIQLDHYSDATMGAMASQITGRTIIYSTVYSGTDQRKHQSSSSLAFVWGIHWWPVNSPHKWPVTRKMFPLHDVIMHQLNFVMVWYRSIVPIYLHVSIICNKHTLIARFMGTTWDPSGAERTQVGSVLAPWTLLSGYITATLYIKHCKSFSKNKFESIHHFMLVMIYCPWRQ